MVSTSGMIILQSMYAVSQAIRQGSTVLLCVAVTLDVAVAVVIALGVGGWRLRA